MANYIIKIDKSDEMILDEINAGLAVQAGWRGVIDWPVVDVSPESRAKLEADKWTAVSVYGSTKQQIAERSGVSVADGKALRDHVKQVTYKVYDKTRAVRELTILETSEVQGQSLLTSAAVITRSAKREVFAPVDQEPV